MITVGRTKRTRSELVISRMCVFSTSLGWMGTAWNDRWLAAVSFGYRRREQALSAIEAKCGQRIPREVTEERLDQLAVRLQAYADGDPDDFRDVSLDWSDMTDFQRRVSLACRAIPYGGTCSYAELASRIGSPNAARAVGNVMARNRIPILIPCHRVLGAAGALGGYSAPGGLDTKRRLLRLEGSV